MNVHKFKNELGLQICDIFVASFADEPTNQLFIAGGLNNYFLLV